MQEHEENMDLKDPGEEVEEKGKMVWWDCSWIYRIFLAEQVAKRWSCGDF